MYSKVIEGVKYEMRPLDPMLVLEHGSKLVSELAAPAVEKLTNMVSQEATAETTKAAGISVVAEAMKRLSLPSVQAAMQVMFKYASANGVELERTWQVHFLGKPKNLVAFLAWGMEAQFGDFFGGLVEQVTKSFNGKLKLLDSTTEQKA